MNKSLKKLVFLLVLTTLIFACTEKKNTVGFQPGSDPKTITFTTSDDIFSEYYSFKEEYTYGYNITRMYMGNMESNGTENEARILIKTSSLPDTVAEFITNPQLILNIDNNYMLENLSATTLIMNKMSKAWLENEATWTNATDSLEWDNSGGDFEAENLTEYIEIIGDSIYIDIPQDLVQEWIETDSINYGLMLYTEEEGMLKIKTSEFTDESSRIEFEYRSSLDDSVKTHNSPLTADTFIAFEDDEIDNFENQLILSNIQPISSILKINISDSLFMNIPESNISDSLDFMRMTINRAQIILYTKSTNQLAYDGSINLKAYNVDSETDSTFQNDQIQDFGADDYTEECQADSFVVDITPIIQGFVGGEVETYGVLFRALNRGENFNFVEFYGPTDAEATDAQKPKLKIMYTVPDIEVE